MFSFYNFLRKRWSEYSNATGQKGTVVDELAVKPTGLVMSDFHASLVNQRRINDISNWESMTEAELDAFGAKFFIPRISGDTAFGSIRIWVDERATFDFNEDSRAISIGSLRYKAAQPGVISRNSFKVSSDRYARYYVDVTIISESAGDIYNVEAGEISALEGVNLEYKMVTNPLKISGGAKHETNEEYYNRLIYSINDRSMMNKRSMFVRLPELFPSISSIYIAAPGDKYMDRDLISGQDVSRPPQRADYLGKTTGDNIVKHLAFYGIFPPNVGSLQKQRWGPFSVHSDYPYPLTIESTDLSADISNSGQTGDPAFHGFPLDQEATNEMYRGLFFDEYKNFMEVVTEDLFNIQDEDVGFTDVAAPSPDWVYGAHGLYRGNMGVLEDGVSDIQVMKFNNNTLTLAGGAENSISTGLDIKKRIGIKVTGTLSFPSVITQDVAPAYSNLQMMVGGINDVNGLVEGYTGIGFGIRLVDPYVSSGVDPDLPVNAIVYFAHSEKYGTGQVFASDDDFTGVGGTGHVGITDLGALAETQWRIEGGVNYSFEFIIHDDLRMTLYLNKESGDIILDDSDNQNNQFYFNLPSTMLNVFSQELFNENTDHYGTTMKVTLDTESIDPADIWTVTDLKAFDTQESKAMGLFALEIDDIEDPVNVALRISGSGAVDGSLSDGYVAYIWDKEISTPGTGVTELTQGGWATLDDVSNPTGTKDVLTQLLTQTIQNLERYKVSSRFGENIFILVVASGTSKMSSRYFNSIGDDIYSRIQVDYLKVEGQSLTMYHANNKADLYVSTVKNSEELEISSIVLTKNSNETFFELNRDNGASMPMESLVSVTIGPVASEVDALSETEYNTVRPDDTLAYSSEETIRIFLNNTDVNEITVEYKSYPEIPSIQDYFDGVEFGKIFGDVLAKHKFPVYLDFSIFYTGNIETDQMVDEIRKYVDDNIDGLFSTREMARYLYNNEFANNIQEPIEVAYERINDDGDVEIGTFTDSLEIRDIDFFRIRNLTASNF